MKMMFQIAAVVLFVFFTLIPRMVLAQDMDADGMPDAWEILQSCLDPNLPDGTLNPDGDSYDSYTEYVNQTDPCRILFRIADSSGPELGINAAFDGTRFLAGISGGSVVGQFLAPTGSRVGGAITLGEGDDFPLLAFDGTNYLVAWTDTSLMTDAVIFGQLISPAGDTVGSAFPITGLLNIDSRLQDVAYGGGKYLAIWEDGRGIQGSDIYGQMVSTAGAPVGLEIAIATATGDDRNSSVAFDGTNFLAVFATARRLGNDYYASDIYGQFVAPAGSLVGSNFIISQNDYASDNPTALAFIGAGPYYQALWTDDLGGDTSWEVYSQKISPAGALIGSPSLIAGGPGPQVFPSLVYNGSVTLIAWNDLNNWDVMGKYYTPNGPPIGDVFPIWADNGNQFGEVAASGNGQFLAMVNSDVTVPPGDGGWTFDDVYGRFLAAPLAGDTIAPAPPANLTVRESGDLELELAWDVPADTDVAGYYIYYGAEMIATVSPNRYRVDPPDPNTEYCFTVRAFDRMGNLSTPSNQDCAINRLALRIGNVDSDLGHNMIQAGRPMMVKVKNSLPSPSSITIEVRNLPSGAWLAADSVQSILAHGVLTCNAPAGIFAGSAEVRVNMDGRGSGPGPVTVIAGNWVPGPYLVSGRVVNSGVGVSGAWVLAMVPNPSSDGNVPANQTTTNAQGYFSLPLPAGNYEIYTGVEGASLLDGQTAFTVAGNMTLTDISLANGVIFSGHVVDSANNSLFLGGGYLDFRDLDSESPVFVDGSFRIVLPPGGPYDYEVGVESILMYQNAERTIATITSDLTGQVIPLDKAELLELYVVNENNDPIPGVEVRVSGDGWETNGEADGDGHVLMPVSGGTVRLELRDNGYPGWPYMSGRIDNLWIPPEGLNLGTITLYDGDLVTGHLQNSDGNPVGGAIYIQNDNPPPDSPFDRLWSYTDIDFDGSINGLAYPGDNWLNFNFGDFNNENGTAYLDMQMNLNISGDTDLGTIVVTEGARLTGSVEDLDGNPMTGLEVRCDNNYLNHYPNVDVDGPSNDFALVLYPDEDYQCRIHYFADNSWTDFPNNPVNCSTACNVGVITLPFGTDYDHDGLTNDDETNVYFTNPYDPDTDGDGLNDNIEVSGPTDPLIADSDSDGWLDGMEVQRGTDPMSATSHPGPAGPEQLINYQGRLMNSAGQPVNGPVPMTFGIFTGETSAEPIWDESQTVTVNLGIYNVLLGSVTMLDPAAFVSTGSPAFYLQVTANGETLAPRSRLSFVPFAMFASRLFEGRQEMDSRTLHVNPAASAVQLHVNFNQAFAQPPKVGVFPLDDEIGVVPFTPAKVNNITTTGFDVTFRSMSGGGSSGSADFTYQAFGH